jgi:hypothetical protein
MPDPDRSPQSTPAEAPPDPDRYPTPPIYEPGNDLIGYIEKGQTPVPVPQPDRR